MISIKHRVNNITTLKNINPEFGIEVDVRAYKKELVLSHEPYLKGESFINFLEFYNHKILILNIKETGIEDEVINLTKKFLNNSEFFLLDIEIPYLVNKNGENKEHLSCRYSEYESIESVYSLDQNANYVWIDTFNNLPNINIQTINFFKTKKTCLVSPSRWGRDGDLDGVLQEFRKFNYEPNYLLA